MRRIRPFLARAAALVVISGTALVPVLTSAAPASASLSTCAGTSLDSAVAASGYVRVPTVADGHPAQWGCLLGVGDNSTAVARLQIDLNNCYHQKLSVDGIFGQNTYNALRYAQGTEHVTQDGAYGPQTVLGTSTYGGFWYQKADAPTGFCSPNGTAGATIGTNGG